MKLVSLVNPDFVHVQQPVNNWKEAINLMVNELVKGYKFNQTKDQIIQSIEERESLSSTAYDNGLAMPHARLDDFDDILISICIPKTPIDVNGKKIGILVLILTSRTSSNIYLQTLASFAKITQDPTLYGALTACKHRNDLFTLLGEIKVKKEITVEDLMSREVNTLKADQTLKDLADLFYIKNIGYAPVIDDKGKLLGEVTMTELLRVGIPNYAMMIGNLKFLSSFEPFEELLKNEDKILVRDIMIKSTVKLDEQTSVIEAALEMTKLNRRHLPVVRDNQVVGILSFMDLLNKVIRG